MNAILKSGNPADAAREAIRRLAMDRIAPTPENFARAYREAAGEANVVLPEQVLGRLGEAMRARRPEASSALRLSECIREGAWADALNMVNEAVGETSIGADAGAEWPRLLQNLLARLDATTPDWTRARKLGAVEHVLRSGAIDAGRTRDKLERLIGAWSQATVATVELVPAALADEAPEISPVAKQPPPSPDEKGDANPWRELTLAALEGYRLPERRQGTTQPRDRFSRIRSRLIDLSVSPDDSLCAELKMACADYQADQLRESAIRERLKALLRLVCDNLNLFADDDAWVKGQVDRICQLLDAPLDELALTEAEDSLRAAVLRSLN
jgi:diguanylate cyclase